MRECALRFFVEAMGKDALLHQAVQEAGRAAAIVLRGKVFGRRDEDVLRIPAEEPEALVVPVTVPEGSTPADLDIKIRVIRQDGQPVEVGAPEQGGTPFRVTVTGDEQGKWFWAKERKNISDAYTLFGKWGANMESNPNWYKSSVDSQVIKW